MNEMEVESHAAVKGNPIVRYERGLNDDYSVISIHPTALVGIADHHTRIFVSGTALAPNSVVTGLLFGYSSDDKVTVIDAEEVDFPHPNQENGFRGESLEELEKGIGAKVQLHTQVFPKHKVLGWYKVVNEKNKAIEDYDNYDELKPNVHDLNVHHRLVGLFSKKPLFLLMNACSMATKMLPEGSHMHESILKVRKTDQLPVFMFEAAPETDSHEPFIMKEFVLEAFDAETISIERVSNDASLLSGISSVFSRLDIIIEYLRKIQSGGIIPNHAIIRDISVLIRLISYIENHNIGGQTRDLDDTQLELYLGSLAKVTMTLNNLSSKFHLLEKRPHSISMKAEK
jgi:hypothetical protein